MKINNVSIERLPLRLPLKFLSWNLGHQTQARDIRPGFYHALRTLKPDVLLLNEYVHAGERDALMAFLDDAGLRHLELSERVGKNNQVLIASRFPMVVGDLKGPMTDDGAGESNFLHVRLAEQSIDIVGIRVPAYAQARMLHDYWQRFADLVQHHKNAKILFIGDFNADPDGKSHIGSVYLARLREQGWHIPRADGLWSFVSGSRIDHALLSPASMQAAVATARYVSCLDGITLASSDSRDRVSDHAVLELLLSSVPVESF